MDAGKTKSSRTTTSTPKKTSGSKPTPQKGTSKSAPIKGATAKSPAAKTTASKTQAPVKDSVKISQEGKAPTKAPGQTPDFNKSFGGGTAKAGAAAPKKTDKPEAGAERSALDEGAKAALQARVIAGQGAGVKGGPLPTQSSAVRKIGAAGGAGAGILAVQQGRAALDSSRGAGERVVSGLQAAGNAAHATHGATQAADILRTNKLNPAPPNPGTVRDIPGRLTQAAGAIKDNAAKIPGAALKGIAQPANAAGVAFSGAQRLAVTAGRAAPLLGGVAQLGQSAHDISKNGLTLENAATGASGTAKLVGAGLVASGIGAPIGAALIAGSTAYDLGKLAYDNREAIGNAASQALSGLGSAGRAALGAIPGLGSLTGGIGRLFG